VGARAVGVGPDRDAELAQPLDEGEVLRIEAPLGLPALFTDRRRVERPRLALPKETNRRMPCSRDARS